MENNNCGWKVLGEQKKKQKLKGCIMGAGLVFMKIKNKCMQCIALYDWLIFI